jgi:hypothetical protein
MDSVVAAGPTDKRKVLGVERYFRVLDSISSVFEVVISLVVVEHQVVASVERYEYHYQDKINSYLLSHVLYSSN